MALKEHKKKKTCDNCLPRFVYCLAKLVTCHMSRISVLVSKLDEIFFARKVLCIADVPSISHSLEQPERLCGNRGLKNGASIFAHQKIRSCHWWKLIAFIK